jgi:hypothetical protein
MLNPASQCWGYPADSLYELSIIPVNLSLDQGLVVGDAIAELLDGYKAVMKHLPGNLRWETVPQMWYP